MRALISQNTKKELWIENLRGMAALLVFISHLYMVNGTSIGFIIGRIGVVWFFLITGYLSVKSRQKKSRTRYLRNRFIRMYPVYWFLLIMQCMVMAVFQDKKILWQEFLFNMTLFQEFIGYECILGASWMMPIQVVFFAGIGVLGIAFFEKRFEIKRWSIDMPYLVMGLMMCLAIITGMIRNITHIPFPVAFFLLLAVAFLGLYRNLRGGQYVYC